MNIKRWKILAVLLAALMALPYALLVVAGCLWLYQNHYVLHFLALTATVMLAGWTLARLLRPQDSKKVAARVEADGDWSPAAQAAWQHVQEISRNTERHPPALDRPEEWWTIFRRILEAVAEEFHPESDKPALEVPLPDALHIVELASRDLRQKLRERVPGSHMVTINDFNRFKRWAGWWQKLYLGYRVAYMGLNPVGALVREVREAATGEMMSMSAEQLQRWATSLFIQKVGFYAIQLYSGHLKLDDEAFQRYTTRESRNQAAEAGTRQEDLTAEPLRILVIGQTKAGKSSLINALFGEVRAATDVIPLTPGIEPFVLEREGMPRAIILDSAGYAAGGSLDEVEEALLQTDLVLLVCSARSAAREPDRALLADLRQRFESKRHRTMPPVLVVLTHIDSLRPYNDWSPPYNLAAPDSAKATSIAAAVRAVAEDLQVSADHVVPVCLLADRQYNVEDGLLPAMAAALPSAQRARLLRTLRQFHDEEYWRLLWRQAGETGRLLAKVGGDWAVRKADKIVGKWTGR